MEFKDKIKSRRKGYNRKIRLTYMLGVGRTKNINFAILDEEANTGYRFKLKLEDFIRFFAQQTDFYVVPKAFINDFIKRIKNYKKIAYKGTKK